MKTLFSWTQEAEQQLLRAHANRRLGAGLMIHAAVGTGGEDLARFAAQLLLCRQSDAPCGTCRDCGMVAMWQHPDAYWVMPIEDSKVIRVEQIRELCDELALTSHGGGAAVAVLSPAETMTENAANALLKTLEEPRGGATLVLLTAAPSRLPATVRSRCQKIRVPAPTRAQSLSWLGAQGNARGSAGAQGAGAKGQARSQEQGGDWNAVLDVLGEVPLTAWGVDPLEFARLRDETAVALGQAVSGELDIPAVADQWIRGKGFDLRLACIENWLTKRIEAGAVRLGQSPELRNSSHLSESASDINVAAWLPLLDAAYELRALSRAPINRALALEQLFWRLGRAGRGAARRAAAN